MLFNNFTPLLSLAFTDDGISFTDIVKATGFLISGGLLTFVGIIFTNKKDIDINQRDNKSEMEKFFAERYKEIYEVQDDLQKDVKARYDQLKDEFAEFRVKYYEKDQQLDEKDQHIDSLKIQIDTLTKEVENLTEKNESLIKEITDLKEQNKILIERIDALTTPREN